MSLLDIKIRWKRFTIGNADLKIECKGSDYFRNIQTISIIFRTFAAKIDICYGNQDCRIYSQRPNGKHVS